MTAIFRDKSCIYAGGLETLLNGNRNPKIYVLATVDQLTYFTYFKQKKKKNLSFLPIELFKKEDQS